LIGFIGTTEVAPFHKAAADEFSAASKGMAFQNVSDRGILH
jgi:hypothetical protein